MKLRTLSVAFTLPILLLLCPLKAQTREASAANQHTYLLNVVEAMKVEWPKNRTLNIVCHGHSVPAGYFKTPVVDSFNAYPHLLHKALKKRYPHAVINVIVTSIGGETSEQGADRFVKEVMTHTPDVVTIDYALNDRGIGLENAKLAWDSMIKTAIAKGCKVILLTPTGDTRAQMLDASDPLSEHAAQIREIAKAHHVALSDSFAAFKNYMAAGGELEDLMSQVNHPNRKGHDLVLAELLKWFPE